MRIPPNAPRAWETGPVTSPEPRPALAKAPDSDLHPVSGQPVPQPSPPPAAQGGKRKGSLARGGATSDSLLGPPKDKLVDLGVRVPKSVRKRLRAEAKARQVSPDDIVAMILDAALD